MVMGQLQLFSSHEPRHSLRAVGCVLRISVVQLAAPCGVTFNLLFMVVSLFFLVFHGHGDGSDSAALTPQALALFAGCRLHAQALFGTLQAAHQLGGTQTRLPGFLPV